MADEVILTTGDLVVNNFYKVRGYRSSSPAITGAVLIGTFVRFNSNGNLKLIADPTGNLYDDGGEIENPDNYYYKDIPTSMISDYQTAKNALLAY